MNKEEGKQIKMALLWELIEEFQLAREEEGCDIDELRLTYNDVEIALYEKMEEIDPSKTLKIND